MLLLNKGILNFSGVNYLSILQDGHTAGWYAYDEASTITKSTGNTVSRWNDLLGSGHDLIQATAGYQPVWSANGILFDGINDFMKAVAFTLNQPEFIYMVVKPISFSTYSTWFDGAVNNSGNVLFGTTTPNIYATAPTGSANNSNASLGNWHIIRVLFNGASSKLIVDATTPTTWNCGANNMSGFTLAKIGTAALYYGHIQTKEIIIRSSADSAGDEAAIYNYLKTKLV